MPEFSSRKLTMLLSGVFLAGLLLFATPQPASANAFTDWLNRIFNQNDERVNHKNAIENSLEGTFNQESNVDGAVGSVMSALDIRLTGVNGDITTPQGAALYKKYGRGAIGDVSSAIPYLFQPPASSTTYVADLLDSAHIIPRAQAQGLGFAALDPILSTWKIFRNLAYLLYVVIFLVIGLMVMFKSQMGKTAVTLQSAIPNIIISLIFVTFSYAIAGFLIDLMYVLMYLLVGMFPDANAGGLMDKNFLALGKEIIMGDGTKSGAFKTFADSVDSFISQTLNYDGVDKNNSVVGFISGMTMSLIMAVAILIGVFKLFFELLKTYVIIVLMIAFSPLLLMLGALPGQDVFQGWIRDLVGHLLAFPTTLLIIIVFKMFTSTPVSGGPDTDIIPGGFLPPFLIGRGSAGALTTLVGIGIVLIMPELIQQMKKAVGVKDGLFTILAKDMGKNFVKDGVYPAAPLLTVPGSVAGSMIGSGVKYAIPNIKNKRFDVPEMWRAMRMGNKVDGKYQGGWKGGVSTGLERAKSLKVTADRAMSGQFFEPETTEKLLAALSKQKEPAKHPTPNSRPSVAGKARRRGS